jgi:ribosomal protein L37AE/L43A
MGIFFNCYIHVNNMQEEKSSSKSLQNRDINLRREEPAFRTVKSCPFCQNISVSHRRGKRDYICSNCQKSFKDPVLKQIKDRRNQLSVPPTLRKTAQDKATG